MSATYRKCGENKIQPKRIKEKKGKSTQKYLATEMLLYVSSI